MISLDKNYAERLKKLLSSRRIKKKSYRNSKTE